MKFNSILSIALLALLAITADAQITIIGRNNVEFNTDSIIQDYDNRPFFGLYRDNYFVLGTAIDSKPTEFNSDIKFQISFRQRLTRSVLPWNSHLFLQYSQKAMWHIFEESLPFHDLNFNPGIGLSKLIIYRGKLIGKASVLFEHESNGRDGTASRSWNKVSFSASAYILPELMVHGKLWIPIIDGQQNRDILKYNGIYQTGLQYLSPNKRWVVDVTLVKRKGWNLSFNTTLNVGFRIRKQDNQFVMLHFYDGYGENLLDYNKYHCRVRVGLLIRPTFFSDF